MEKITIKNFLNLNNIELKLSKINILIGSQANGKSIIAKLIYFFKDFFIKYRTSIDKHQKKAEFDKNVITNFKKIFPEYSWNEQEFSILYQFNKYSISLTNKQTANSKYKLFLEYSEYLVKARRKLLTEYDKRNKSLEYIETNKVPLATLRNFQNSLNEIFSEYILRENQVNSLDLLTFIPAGRSFFANLQSNIFSFISGDILIDYFLTEFGSDYEVVKKLYGRRENFNQQHTEAVDELISQIIVGNYIYDQGEDWIYASHNTKRINVSNSSSGQQEALPMILILAVLPFLGSTRLFTIEEPEAHLFPQSQEHIVKLISLVFNITEKKHSFFITTHSPYILTAFNNLIQANNSLKALRRRKASNDLIQELINIIPEKQMLDINDIGAYTIKNGTIESIINKRNNLIDTNVIDEISNEFSINFEKLLDLELGE